MPTHYKGFPVGPDTYKTGNRVPRSGLYVDQYGVMTEHEAHRTFPPCVGRKGECAFRRQVLIARRSA